MIRVGVDEKSFLLMVPILQRFAKQQLDRKCSGGSAQDQLAQVGGHVDLPHTYIRGY